MNTIDEIKKRINIVELATEFGLQPTKMDFIFSIYKEEKNRSLKLYPETNSYYCFATGKGGDVINFFADFKKLNNKAAIVLLYKELGLNNGYEKLNLACSVGMDEKSERTIEQKRCSEIYQTFETYSNGVDERTLQYLTGPKRGLTEKSIKKFRLFVIKDLKDTIDDLLNFYSLEELKASGLFNENGRFVFVKHQLIIPYLEDDRIVYLRGRVMPEYENNGIGKYIGLAGQTAKRLFNLNDLKNLVDSSEVLLCEGEFDTIRTAQQGIKAVGVPGVNNFPEHGRDLLRSFNVFICFDNDEAGKKGMKEVTDKMSSDTKGIYLKEHKDLTEYFNSNGNNNLLFDEKVEVKTIKAEISKKSNLKLLTAREIQELDIPPIDWIVNELIPEGLVILAGRPKIGKSFFALNVALSVANGSKALGYFETKKCTVLYIALEDGLQRVKNRINNILGSETDKRAPENLLYFEKNYNFPKINDGGIEEIEKIIEDRPDLKLIIIDTLGRSIADKGRKDRNIYLADYEIASKLQELAMRKNISILILHHTKKGSEENVFDEISGTTGLTGAMDTMMVIKEKNKDYTLHITGRDVAEANYRIVFDKNLFCWNIVDKKEEHKLTAERKEIVELFKKYDRKMRTGEVAQLLGKELSNISGMVRKLVDDDILMSPAYGTYELVEKEESKKPNMTKKDTVDLFNNTQSGQSG